MGDGWKRSGPWLEAERGEWTYQLLLGADEQPSGLVDVHLLSRGGERFAGTLGTLAAVQEVLNSNRRSGECLNGQYFWSTGFVLVASLEPSAILDVLDHLVASGEIATAFENSRSDD